MLRDPLAGRQRCNLALLQAAVGAIVEVLKAGRKPELGDLGVIQHPMLTPRQHPS